MTNFTNTDSVIDSRDIIERIEYLQSLTECGEEIDPDLLEELETLKELAEECEQYASDWVYGETLIHRAYFEQYVEEMLQDCGDLPRNLPHYLYIDWEKTAGCIEQDYATVDFDGEEYLIRSV